MKKLMLFMSLLFGLVFARDLIIATGSPSGNYYKVGTDIVNECAQEIKNKYNYDLKVVSTSGSTENLMGLVDKKYSLGMVQSDVLLFMSKKNPLLVNQNRVAILLDMYPEFLHILIPKSWKPESTGFWSNLTSLFNKNNGPISITKLKNQIIYAWGGSAVSAQALSYFLNLNLKVTEPKDRKNLVNLDKPIILVTGVPDQRVQKLLNSGKWYIISINAQELAQRAGIYRPTNISYLVNGKPVTARTVSIRSELLARVYRGKKRQNAIKALKQCIMNNMDDLIDDGESPFWEIIQKENSENNKINWRYIE